MKNDDSVKFYTWIPTLGYLNMLVNLITSEAYKLKYWDKNKDKKLKYQTSPVTIPGPKRNLGVLEELLICLVRLRLGLMGRQLADISPRLRSVEFLPPGFVLLQLCLRIP